MYNKAKKTIIFIWMKIQTSSNSTNMHKKIIKQWWHFYFPHGIYRLIELFWIRYIIRITYNTEPNIIEILFILVILYWKWMIYIWHVDYVKDIYDIWHEVNKSIEPTWILLMNGYGSFGLQFVMELVGESLIWFPHGIQITMLN